MTVAVELTPSPVSARGRRKRYRHRTREVCRVYVGGIGLVSIRLQMPVTESRSCSRSSRTRCAVAQRATSVGLAAEDLGVAMQATSERIRATMADGRFVPSGLPRSQSASEGGNAHLTRSPSSCPRRRALRAHPNSTRYLVASRADAASTSAPYAHSIPAAPRHELVMRPHALRASSSLSRARLVRSVKRSAIGERKVDTRDEEKEARRRTDARDGWCVHRKATRADHDEKKRAAGNTYDAVVDVGHDERCRAYRRRG
mmetsp:Transcript_3936/g.10866  ORF Transcript_3936/g.10866 Transcript_3936/m.10866 type:complete len:258 (-) Transcript_3936:106-879(-)